jgi:hypothetical protein
VTIIGVTYRKQGMITYSFERGTVSKHLSDRDDSSQAGKARMITKEKCLLCERADRLFALSATLHAKKGINHDARFDNSC